MDIHAYNFDSLAEKEWKYPTIAIAGNEKRIANHVAKFNKIAEQARNEGI